MRTAILLTLALAACGTAGGTGGYDPCGACDAIQGGDAAAQELPSYALDEWSEGTTDEEPGSVDDDPGGAPEAAPEAGPEAAVDIATGTEVLADPCAACDAVQPTDTRGDDSAPAADLPPGATAAQATALQAVNAYRAEAGVSPADEVEALNESASAHASFVVTNCAKYASTQLSVHEENASWPGFTGVQFWDRMAHFGYQMSGGSEVIAFWDDPVPAVNQWVDSVYHRLALLDPATTDIGYGGATGGKCGPTGYNSVDVVDVGLNMSGSHKGPALYPANGSTGIPCTFDGLENPTPPVPPAGWPSGYIVTVQYGMDAGTVTVTSHDIRPEGGATLAHTVLATKAGTGVTADSTMFDGSVALYPQKPLAANTKYEVSLGLNRAGQAVKLDWTFTTGNCN